MIVLNRKNFLPVIIAMVIVSITALTYFTLTRAVRDYQFANRELVGAHVHTAIFFTLLDVEKLTLALEQKLDKNKLSQLKAQLQNDLLQVDHILKSGEAVTIAEDWRKLKADIVTTFLAEQPKPHQASIQAQKAVIESLSQFLGKVSIASNMVLDPALPSYKTMQLMTENIPAATSLIAQIQRDFLSQHQHAQQHLKLLILIGQLGTVSQSYWQNYQAISEPKKSNSTMKPNALIVLEQHLHNLEASAHGQFVSIDTLNVEASNASAALKSAYLLHQRSFKSLIAERMLEITKHIATVLLMVLLAAFACVTFVIYGFRQSQQKIDESQHMQAVFSTVTDALLVMTDRGVIETVNPAVETLFGYTEAEIIGRKLSILMPITLREAYEQYIQDYRKTGQSKLLGIGRELIGRRKDGAEFAMGLSISETLIEGERMLMVAAQDLTTIKLVENAMQEQKRQMQQLIDNQSVAAFLIDRHHNVVHWNLACEALTGTKAAEVVGTQDAWRAFYSKARPCLANLVLDQQNQQIKKLYGVLQPSTLIKSGWHAEAWFENLGGKKRYVIFDAAPIFDANGEISSVIETLQDITEMKLVEHALAEETDISVRALKSLEAQKYALDQHALVTRKDKLGNITYANEKICEISGYSQAELIGKSLDMLDAGVQPKEFFDAMHQTINQGQVWHGEVCYRNKEGGLFWLDTTIVPILDDDGKPEEFIAIRTDITARKNVESELKQAYANLEEFTAVASHDLKSPIRGIADLVEWITEDLGSQAQGDIGNNLDRVSVRVKRMERLIDDLLQYSRAGKKFAEVTQIDPIALVHDTVDFITAPSGFSIRVTGSSKKMTTAVTPLQTCLRNLIANAIKHHDQAVGHIEINVSSNKGFCIFRVIDDGPGIPELARERVFKLFQTLSKAKDSSGLGLAVSKRMVEAHDGHIEIEPNTDARGTVFKVSWPLSALQIKPPSKTMLEAA